MTMVRLSSFDALTVLILAIRCHAVGMLWKTKSHV